MNEKLDSFLKDLAKLTKKYNMEIGGCGCCGSPFVSQKVGSSDLCHDDLTYEDGKYAVKEDTFKTTGG